MILEQGKQMRAASPPVFSCIEKTEAIGTNYFISVF